MNWCVTVEHIAIVSTNSHNFSLDSLSTHSFNDSTFPHNLGQHFKDILVMAPAGFTKKYQEKSVKSQSLVHRLQRFTKKYYIVIFFGFT